MRHVALDAGLISSLAQTYVRRRYGLVVEAKCISALKMSARLMKNRASRLVSDIFSIPRSRGTQQRSTSRPIRAYLAALVH